MESKITNASLFKTLFSKSIHAGCLTDAEFNLIDYNTAFLGMLHLGSDIEGKSLWEVFTAVGLNPADLPKLNQLIKQLHLGEPFTGKLRINTKNARRLKIDFTGHSLGHGGDFKYYFEFTDLTAEIEVRKALRASMSSLQIATDISNLGIFDYDFRTEKWLLNPRFYQILGISMSIGDNIENTVNSIIQPEDFPMLLSEWVDKKTNGDKLDIIFRIIHPKEGIKYVKCIGECLKDTQNQPWRFVGTVQDISEQIIQEKNLISEERWKFAVEGDKNGIWDWNVLIDELFFSESCYTILGYSKNDYLLKEVNTWIAEIHPDYLGQVELTAGKMRTGEIDSFHVEMRLKCADGSYKWILNRGKTFKRDVLGKPMRILGL